MFVLFNFLSYVQCIRFNRLPSIISGGIFDKDDGGSYSASKLAFDIAIDDVNSDGSVLTGVTLKGVVNTTTALDIKQSVTSCK